MEPLKKVIITQQISVAENTYVIKFKRDFDFIPGQIIGITNHVNIPPRLYSICSSPTDYDISILYNVKEDGILTPLLSTLKAADTIFITEPQGSFTFSDEPAWWIATGTGIAPFYSMYQAGQNPLKLIQGDRTKNDLFFQSDFEKLPDYIKCCSRDSGDGIFPNRLTVYLKQLEPIPTNINYYLCGSAEMVVDVRNLIIEKGVPFKNIITEIYF